MKTPRTITIAMALVAAGLFAESLHILGVEQIVDGLARMGWGFAAILAIAGARDVVRAIAWTLTIERPARLGFLPAFRARLAGEALNTLLPMGMGVGEPAKAYQVLAVAEVYVALLLISPQRPTIASALVLETVSRGVTIFFKMIPMRIGVDEASSSFVAGHVSLDPATGLTLALVRKLRMLFW